MDLSKVRDLFEAVLPGAVYHIEARTTNDKYIVWAEDGQVGASYADDKMVDQEIEGTVDLFTRYEYDHIFDTLQMAMNNSDMTWRFNSTQRETSTGYFHHEWVWRMVKSIGKDD